MTILITGSSRGLGSELAKLFLRAGDEVITHRRAVLQDKVETNIKNEIVCDLLDINALEYELKRLKQNGCEINHLICNAGKSSYPQNGIENIKNVNAAIADNLIVTANSVYAVINEFLNSLETVTIIGSICGEEVIVGAPLEYSVAKSSIKSFTKLCAHKYADLNIRFNIVTPGNLYFEGSVWHQKKLHDEQSYNNYIDENVPTKEIGTPNDIYKVIRLLIDSQSTFINGSNIVVDGSQTKKW